MTNADKFKNLFGIYATELWSMPEKDFLKWLNSDVMNCSEIPNNSGTISRQAAIDVLSLGKEIISRVLDDTDVVGTDREKYSWGLGLIESNIKDIEELPSAQPEIIRCKDCSRWCVCHHSDDWYCADAERRTDE